MVATTMEWVDYRHFNHDTSETVQLRHNGVPYPDYDSYQVVGNLLTPRVYGKDLSVFEVASSGRIAMTVNDIYSLDVSRENQTSNVFLSTVNNNDSLTIVTSNVLDMIAHRLEAQASNINIRGDTSSVTCSELLSISAPNVSITTPMDFSIDGMGAAMNITPSNIVFAAELEINITGSNDVSMLAHSNVFVNANSRSFITLTGLDGKVDLRGDEVKILTNGSLPTSPALTAMTVYRDGSSGNNVVKIDGNLVITGTFETQDVTNTNLNVNDKTLQLAHPEPNGPPYTQDGPHNDGAGLIINGVNLDSPLTFAREEDKIEFYRKSILWKYNNGGIDTLGTSRGVSTATMDLNESFWDVRGGGMMFSVNKHDPTTGGIHDLSYGFRINEHDQFELYKRYRAANGSYVIKRISRWGGGGGNIALL